MRNEVIDEIVDDVHDSDDDDDVASENDQGTGSDDGEEHSVGDVEGSEMEGVGQGDDNVDVPAVSRHGRVELESVAALCLRLALAQEERRTRTEERLAKERE